MTPNWSCTIGDAKLISGYATNNGVVMDGSDDDAGSLEDFTSIEAVFRHQETGKHYVFDATADIATGLFSYRLMATDLTRPGAYEVSFRGIDGAGNPCTFPEARKPILMVYRKLDE